MKLKRIILAAAAAAAFAAAGMYAASVTKWFSQSFDGLSVGSSFKGNAGTVGGKWDNIEDGVATVNKVAGRMCIDIDTSKSSTAMIRFVPTNSTASVQRYDIAICTQTTPWYPTVSEGEKGALILMDNLAGLKVFGGYVGCGANGKWVTLYGHGIEQSSKEWLDCRAEFTTDKGVTSVSYFVKNGTAGYQLLAASDGQTSFTLTDAGANPKDIAFRGIGSVGAFGGSAISQSVKTWKGGDGDWDIPANWEPAGVPQDGETAKIDIAGGGQNVTIQRTVGGKTYKIVVMESAKIALVSGGGLSVADKSLGIESGVVKLFGDFTEWGTVVVAPRAKLYAQGTFYGLEMGYFSTLQVDPSTNVTVTANPIHLDGVIVNLTSTPPSASQDPEAFELVNGPYGSGGELEELKVKGITSDDWAAAWHGRLDGTSAMWIVNKGYKSSLAVWKDGAWGSLEPGANWEGSQPGADVAARVGNGQAHVSQWNTFLFSRSLEIGMSAAGSGEVDMSGGAIKGTENGAAVVVGAGNGDGVLDIVGGTVRPYDYLWNYAVTVGADQKSSGTVKVRGGALDAAGGGVNVGAAGVAQMEILEGRATVGGPFAVGYAGKLGVAGGSLTVSNSVYVGRSTRGEKYDVAMTVDGGAVSNVAKGTFMVGSFGGVGSKATMTLAGGETYAASRFVCGGYRSARVDVTGGTLVAPEICVGQDLIGDEDTAAFSIVSGRIVTAGFTSGTSGGRTVSLSGGELAATAANADFFKGLDAVRLDGEPTVATDFDIATSAGLIGPGGLVKAGEGIFAACGYAAWAGKTTVAAGVLDMRGGMVMGELDVANGASVENAKYDNIDKLLPFLTAEKWTSGTLSVRPYVYVDFEMKADGTSTAVAKDDKGVEKGAVGSSVSETAGRVFRGKTALGWTNLAFQDGTAVEEGKTYALRMAFDFRSVKAYGKPYVIYYADRGNGYERMVADGGRLSVFPVAGDTMGIKTFEGTAYSGKQLYAATGQEFYWIGPDDGAWNNGQHWAYASGGAAAGKYPDATGPSGSVAIFENPARVSLPVAAKASLLLVNANVSLSGGNSLAISSAVTGVGSLMLSGAALQAAGKNVPVNVPVEVEEGTANAVFNALSSYGFVLDGEMRGTGAIAFTSLGTTQTLGGPVFAGDNAAFGGIVKIYPYWDGATSHQQHDAPQIVSPRASGANAQWEINVEHEYSLPLYPGKDFFGRSESTYRFGSLKANFHYQNDDNGYWMRDGVTLEVGALDLDGYAVGTCAGKRGAIDWIAPTATFTNGVSGLEALRLRGGGTMVVGGAAALPSDAISFLERGGVLRCDADADISGLLRQSTAPIAFDDGGIDRVWTNALAASNVGGFIKRGAGTLTLDAVPEYGGVTVVEEGTLVVPYGTRLESLTVSRNGKVILNMGNSTSNGIALAIGCANRELTGKYFGVTNVAQGYAPDITFAKNNGLIVSRGSEAFVWTGKENGKWSNAVNWTVNGQPAKRYPESQDDVVFSGPATVEVGTNAVRSVVGNADLSFCGTNAVLTAVGSVSLSGGKLTLMDNASLVASDAAIAALAGTGTVRVASGSLELSPGEGVESRFVGVLSVTDFVKAGKGVFEYVPYSSFTGTVTVSAGTFKWNCAVGGMANQKCADLTMLAESELDLCSRTNLVNSFKGAGIVKNGVLMTADGYVTQFGGALSVPAVDQTTYVASRAGEKLKITDASDKAVRIVIPLDWFAAGVSGRRAVFCESKNIIWDIRSKTATTTEPVDEGDGWWTIGGGGFTIRLK